MGRRYWEFSWRGGEVEYFLGFAVEIGGASDSVAHGPSVSLYIK